jgi:hypothetical protein
MLRRRCALILASAMALAGCSAGVHQISPAAATGTSSPAASSPAASSPVATEPSSPAPGPVSTAATLADRCVPGFVMLDPQTGQAVSFVPFTDLSALRPGPDVHGGYRLTLTGASPQIAEVDGFSVAFYANGSEVGSATEGPFTSPRFITHGQSLSWTETTDAMNVGTDGAVGTADTCGLVQWTRPGHDEAMSLGLARKRAA